jgi:hypothetical protein
LLNLLMAHHAMVSRIAEEAGVSSDLPTRPTTFATLFAICQAVPGPSAPTIGAAASVVKKPDAGIASECCFVKLKALKVRILIARGMDSTCTYMTIQLCVTDCVDHRPGTASALYHRDLIGNRY